MSSNAGKNAIVLLTGSPGVGKTTIVEKVCGILKEKNIPHRGFFTKEIRANGKREGFQVISVDGQTGVLASIKSTSSKKVGQYGVDIEDFERIAIQQFKNLVNDILVYLDDSKESKILIIDEIGKMEMFSEKFKTAVKHALGITNLKILATIPISQSIPFVEDIRNHPNGKLFQVDRSNRDFVIQDILTALLTY